MSLDLELYCESFRENAIDGVELSNMTGEVLASDLGIGEEQAGWSFEFILICLQQFIYIESNIVQGELFKVLQQFQSRFSHDLPGYFVLTFC